MPACHHPRDRVVVLPLRCPAVNPCRVGRIAALAAAWPGVGVHLPGFPAAGVDLSRIGADVLTPELYAGVMFLCCLPSTVQSSIAFTSIAKGNVAAAICSASFSNLIGIVLTPVLVTMLLITQTGRGVSLAAVRDIVLQLLVPFVAGQLLQRWIGGFVARHKKVLGYVDRGSVLLVVYAAFSDGVVAGIWHRF